MVPEDELFQLLEDMHAPVCHEGHNYDNFFVMFVVLIGDPVAALLHAQVAEKLDPTRKRRLVLDCVCSRIIRCFLIWRFICLRDKCLKCQY